MLLFKRVRAGRHLAACAQFLPSVPFLKFRMADVVALHMGYKVGGLGLELTDLDGDWLQFRLYDCFKPRLDYCCDLRLYYPCELRFN